MKFTEVDVKKLKGYKETKLQRLIKDFLNAEITVAELTWEPEEYKSPSSVQSAVNSAIKRFKTANVKCQSVDKKVFLINTLLYEQEIREV